MTRHLRGIALPTALVIGLLAAAPGCDNTTNDAGNAGPKGGAAPAGGGGPGPASQADAYKDSIQSKQPKSAAKESDKAAAKAATKDAVPAK